ncbi:zinc-dependent alcohol dehydrogenase [Microbacterium marinilacus]|uniref:Galactitol-1-phosphate 5-dehydrogenase n=1 Tax=Microbacterium marinilacus TaxID=415209 RepID=A0ABP7BFS6_9MICO|nr:zinc-binding dehydrogenase [Microbacterium marinilacus]MBY0689021.1 zinc-binding dehydrogenase [Microbacterium marinilacus]
MRALVLDRIGHLEVAELTATEPGPGEVQIRIAATGICGSDVHGYTGENGRRHPGQVMGHESSGVVSAVGAGVAEVAVGDPVTFNPVVVPDDDVTEFAGREQMSPRKRVVGVDPSWVSSFAELVVVPARNVVPLSRDLPIERGALIEPLAVAVHAVRRAGVQRGHRVLVVGGGPIGQSAVLALRMAGAGAIVVSEVDRARRELVARLGADTVDASAAGAVEEAQRLAGGQFDVAIDAVGIEPTIAAALRATAIGGTVCLVGMGAPRLVLDAFLVSTEERTVVGSFTYSAADFRDAAEWIARAGDSVDALITEQVPLADAPDAFERLARGGAVAGKIIVRLDA